MSSNAIEAVYTPSVPAPLSTVESAVKHAKEFGRIKASLLDRTRHINNIGGKDRVNAAGWQVISAALSVRVEIISKNAQGTPGAIREILEAANGKKIVSYSITVRATAGDRIQEHTGRCDSSEAKHNQYEHKMEKVAGTRARNAAICAIVGGEPGDNADEADDDLHQHRAQPQERKQYSTEILIDLHADKGRPGGSLRNWMVENISRFGSETKKITPEQSVETFRKLSELA